MNNAVRFKDLSLRDKERIYAKCYGNPISIAIEMNSRNGANAGDDLFVSFQDIQNDLKEMSEEDRNALDEAKKVMIDKKVWDTFDEGNPSFVKNIAEKQHPAFKTQNQIALGGVKLTVEHIIRAAELSGENPKELVDDLEVPADAEVVSGK